MPRKYRPRIRRRKATRKSRSLSKPARKQVRKIVDRAIAANIEDKYFDSALTSLQELALFDGGVDASSCSSGYLTFSLFAGSQLPLGTGVDERLGDRIKLKRIEGMIRMQGQTEAANLFNHRVKMMLVRHKSTLPEQTFNATQILDPDQSLAALNPTFINVDFFTPDSLRNPGYLPQYKVMKTIQFNMPAETSTAATNKIKTFKYSYRFKKSDLQYFDDISGQLQRFQYRWLCVCDNGCSGSTSVGPTPVQSAGGSGLYVSFGHRIWYEDA